MESTCGMSVHFILAKGEQSSITKGMDKNLDLEHFNCVCFQ